MRRDFYAPARHAVAMASTVELGAAAEVRAAEYLKAHGLVVVARNLRCKAGELDLVCLDREVLVIVEVRRRSRADFGGAPASVTAGKRRRLIRATRFFWQRQPDWRERILRFDVVALQGTPPAGDAESGPEWPDVAWIQDAFRAAY